MFRTFIWIFIESVTYMHSTKSTVINVLTYHWNHMTQRKVYFKTCPLIRVINFLGAICKKLMGHEKTYVVVSKLHHSTTHCEHADTSLTGLTWFSNWHLPVPEGVYQEDGNRSNTRIDPEMSFLVIEFRLSSSLHKIKQFSLIMYSVFAKGPINYFC